MQTPIEWNLRDLQSLIANKVQESINLDYKGSDALAQKNEKAKTDLAKDVSAFANSAGGTLVYGVTENEHLPEEIDKGLDPSDLTREWIEQVINSRIQPRIDGIRISQIDLTNSRVAYAVSVPQSLRAPHMAFDKRYYKRFNFLSVPMEDYEVKDVMRRFESPDLRLEATFTGDNTETDYLVEGDKAVAQLILWAVNSETEPAQHASFRLIVDGELSVGSPMAMFAIVPQSQSDAGQNARQPTVVRRLWQAPKDPPMLQEERVHLGHFAVRAPDREWGKRYRIDWLIRCPRAADKTGVFHIEFFGRARVKLIMDRASDLSSRVWQP